MRSTCWALAVVLVALSAPALAATGALEPAPWRQETMWVHADDGALGLALRPWPGMAHRVPGQQFLPPECGEPTWVAMLTDDIQHEASRGHLRPPRTEDGVHYGQLRNVTARLNLALPSIQDTLPEVGAYRLHVALESPWAAHDGTTWHPSLQGSVVMPAGVERDHELAVPMGGPGPDLVSLAGARLAFYLHPEGLATSCVNAPARTAYLGQATLAFEEQGTFLLRKVMVQPGAITVEWASLWGPGVVDWEGSWVEVEGPGGNLQATHAQEYAEHANPFPAGDGVDRFVYNPPADAEGRPQLQPGAYAFRLHLVDDGGQALAFANVSLDYPDTLVAQCTPGGCDDVRNAQAEPVPGPGLLAVVAGLVAASLRRRRA